MNQDSFESQREAANPFSRPLDQPQSPQVNPFAPTTEVSATDGLENDLEAFRRHYLNHEASVKSVGLLYLLGSVFGIVFTIIMLGTIATGLPQAGQAEQGIFFAMLFIYAVIGVLCGYAGWGLRRFWPSARIIGIIISALGLLGFPLGTLINAYILYLLVSEKGTVVFSDRYQEVVRQTPHIKYKTSIIVKFFLGLLLIVFALIFIAVVFAGP